MTPPGLCRGPFVKLVCLILLTAPLKTPALGHLLVKISVDYKDCDHFSWRLQQQVLTRVFAKHSELPLDGKGKHCGCQPAQVSGCSNDTARAEETLIYYTQNNVHESQLASLNTSFSHLDRVLTDIPGHIKPGIICAYVLEATTSDVQMCYQYKELDNSSSSFQFSVQRASTAGLSGGNNVAVIAGAVAGGLAGLGLLAGLASLLYRKLKQAAQVSDSASASDVKPIIPTDFAITEAPNSVAPAGT